MTKHGFNRFGIHSMLHHQRTAGMTYMTRAKDDQIHRFADTFGLDEDMLRKMMAVKVDETNINEFGRLDNLVKTADIEKAKAFFGDSLALPLVRIRLNKTLREFILSGGHEISKP